MMLFLTSRIHHSQLLCGIMAATSLSVEAYEIAVKTKVHLFTTAMSDNLS
jgi:hypothetical protein